MKSQPLSPGETKALLAVLSNRFSKNTHRHTGITWTEVQNRLENNPEKLRSLAVLEATGGEPDVTGKDIESGGIWFMDCSKESPAGRRSLSYDADGRLSRKDIQPESSAVEQASEFGAILLDEADYRFLQSVNPVDLKTSSWLKTPEKIRQLGGALFGDRRYETVFVYHNGAPSFYAARGFRTKLLV